MRKWIVRMVLAVFLAAGVATVSGCDKKDDHKGHDHKAGEKH